MSGLCHVLFSYTPVNSHSNGNGPFEDVVPIENCDLAMLDYQHVLYIKIGDLTYPIPFKEVTHPYVYREAEKWLNDGFADRMELR